MSQLKGEKTKQRMLEIAADLFVSQGYHGTSTRQITDKLELSPGALYTHFKGKEEVFQSVLEEFHPWLYIPESVKLAEGESVEEFVRDAAGRLVKFWDDHSEMLKLHLIEMIEFNGSHLPNLFGNKFEKMTDVLKEIVNSRPHLEGFTVANLSRALLGLFFVYLMDSRFMAPNADLAFEQDDFNYLTDAYLFGVLNKDELFLKNNDADISTRSKNEHNN
jgi:AcrR family transcriptional regulator